MQGSVFAAHRLVAGPAERPPPALEDGLVDRILDDTGAEQGQLPLVESLLARLWERGEGGSPRVHGGLSPVPGRDLRRVDPQHA
jgi:hypothetical protein